MSHKDMDHAHKETISSILSTVNKTLHVTLNSTTPHKNANLNLGGHRGRGGQLESYPGWTHEQIQTLIYICLAFFCIISISIIGFLYMRSMREKRRSAQAIKSLLDMMAENRSIQSVYTMENGNHHHHHRHHGGRPQHHDGHAGYFPQPLETATTSTAVSEAPPLEPFPAELRPGVEPVVGLAGLEDRIHLPPLSDEPKMPSPHLSAPPLPPIKRPRPRPSGVSGSGVSTFKPAETPSASELEAISKSLREAELLRYLS